MCTYIYYRVDLIIMAAENKMSNFITKMGLFLLIIAFTDGSPQRVQLFSRSPLQRDVEGDKNHEQRGHFFSQGPVLSYDGERGDFVPGKMSSHCSCFCGKHLVDTSSTPIERCVCSCDVVLQVYSLP